MSKKVFIGTVVSTKMKSTVVVSIEMPKKHKVYGKAIRNTRRIKAHTELGLALGDVVTIEESRPFSKHVAFVVTNKLAGGKVRK